MRQVELFETVKASDRWTFISQAILPYDLIFGLLMLTDYLVKEVAVVIVKFVCGQVDLLNIHRLRQTGHQNLQDVDPVDTEIESDLLDCLILQNASVKLLCTYVSHAISAKCQFLQIPRILEIDCDAIHQLDVFIGVYG